MTFRRGKHRGVLPLSGLLVLLGVAAYLAVPLLHATAAHHEGGAEPGATHCVACLILTLSGLGIVAAGLAFLLPQGSRPCGPEYEGSFSWADPHILGIRGPPLRFS